MRTRSKLAVRTKATAIESLTKIMPELSAADLLMVATEPDPVKAQERWEAICRRMTPTMIQQAAKIIKGGKAARNSQSIVKLIEMITAYGFGRPKMSVDLQGAGSVQTFVVIERAAAQHKDD